MAARDRVKRTTVSRGGRPHYENVLRPYGQASAQPEGPIATFPGELLIQIFQSLSSSEQASASGVCKAFYAVLREYRRSEWNKTVTQPTGRFLARIPHVAVPADDFLAPAPREELDAEGFERRLAELGKVDSMPGDPRRHDSFATAIRSDYELYDYLFKTATQAYSAPNFQTRAAVVQLISVCFALDGINNTFTTHRDANWDSEVVYVSVGRNRRHPQMADLLNRIEDIDEDKHNTTMLILKDRIPQDDSRYARGHRWEYSLAMWGTIIKEGNRAVRETLMEAGWASRVNMSMKGDGRSVKALLQHGFTGGRDVGADGGKYYLSWDALWCCVNDMYDDGFMDDPTHNVGAGCLKFASIFCARLVCSSLIFNNENKHYVDENGVHHDQPPRLRVYDLAC